MFFHVGDLPIVFVKGTLRESTIANFSRII